MTSLLCLLQVKELDLDPIESAEEVPVVVHGTYRKAWESIKVQVKVMLVVGGAFECDYCGSLINDDGSHHMHGSSCPLDTHHDSASHQANSNHMHQLLLNCTISLM